MNKKGGGYVRVKERTQLAIKIISGEIQAKTGEYVSADDVLWSVIKQLRPDIAERAEELHGATEPKSDEKPKS